MAFIPVLATVLLFFSSPGYSAVIAERVSPPTTTSGVEHGGVIGERAVTAVTPNTYNVLINSAFPSNLTDDDRQRGHPCHWDFMEYTEKHWHESRTTEWYANWRLSVENDGRLKTIGETTLFAKSFWNGRTYECSQGKHCHPEPSCEMVYNHLQSYLYLGKDEDFIIAETRRVLFSLQSINAMFRNLNKQFELVRTTQMNGAALIDQLILDFTVQVDERADAICKLVRSISVFFIEKSIETIIKAIIALGTGMDEAGQETNKALKIAENLPKVPNILHGYSKVLGADWKKNFDRAEQFYKFTRQVVEWTIDYDKIDNGWKYSVGEVHHEYGSQPPPHSGSTPDLHQLPSGFAYVSAFCRGNSGRPDENYRRAASMAKLLQSKYSMDRFKNLNLQHMLFDGTAVGQSYFKNFTISNFMAMGFWKPSTVQSRAREIYDEKKMTDRTRDALITVAAASGKNYVKCMDVPSISTFCPWLNGDQWRNNRIQGMRKCYYADENIQDPDGPGTVCQVQRWQSRNKQNKEDEFTGLANLKIWNLTSDAIIDSSLRAYRKYHNHLDYTSFAPTLNPSQLDVESSVALPVCYSKKNVIADTFKANVQGDVRSHEYPFSCGDWASNETRKFSDSIFMKKGSLNGEIDDLKAADTFQKWLPRNTRGWPPLTRFLMLCSQDMSWGFWVGKKPPITDRKAYRIYKQSTRRINMLSKHPQCDAIKSNTSGLNELEANIAFCSNMKKKGTSEYALAKSERHKAIHVKRKRAVNHRKRCLEFEKNLKKLQKKGMPIEKGFDMEPLQPENDYSIGLKADSRAAMVMAELGTETTSS